MPLSQSERAALQALIDQKRREKTGQNQTGDTHGSNATYRAGCRCGACKETQRELKRRWRASNPEKAREQYREAYKRKRAKKAQTKAQHNAELERRRKHREKLRQDPERHEAWLEYRRDWYRKRRESDPEWWAKRLAQKNALKRKVRERRNRAKALEL